MKNYLFLIKIIGLLCLFGAMTGCKDTDEPEKSSDIRLNYIRLAHEGVEWFSIYHPSREAYAVTVPYAVASLTVEVESFDLKSSVTCSPLPANGVISLHAGVNTLVFTVTAEDRTARTYTVNVSVETEIPLSGSVTLFTDEDFMPEEIEVLVYADASGQPSALIGQTVADGADNRWQMTIPGVYRKVYVKVAVRDGSGLEYARMLGEEDIPEPGKENMHLVASFVSPRIISLGFPASETGLAKGLNGVIDDGLSRITFRTQQWIETLDRLSASFAATGVVTVDDAVQESSRTPNDFRRGQVVYTVTTDDGRKRDYSVVFESPQTSGLPLLKIDTRDKQAITSKEEYVKTNIRLVTPDCPDCDFNHTDYVDEIRGRGNSTWTYPKKPYRLKFDKKISLFGYEAAKSWVLLANFLDPTLIMNTVTLELGRRFGLPYTNHCIHVEVFLNGSYRGSYLLTEQVQVGKGRVDIDEKEGFFVEVDSYYDEDPKFRTPHYDLPVMIKSPEDLASPEDYDFVQNSLNALDERVSAPSFPNSGYRDLIRLQTFVDYLLVNEIVGNGELSWPKSVYMYRDKGEDARISLGPLWDFDWAFGYAGEGHVYFNHLHSRTSDVWHPFLLRFFDDPVFRTAYRERWNEMYAEIAGMESFIDDLALSLEKSQKENFLLWEDNGTDYATEIAGMKAWWREHIARLDAEINR
ncbi:MAG: CotH kinase family protein [Tannerella sp.]|jgi:spore coat protein CotH|nr:CotH kinase family protein [Tannerella sp.]